MWGTMDAGFYEYRRLHGGIMEGMIVASSLAKIDGRWSTPFLATDELLPIPSVSFPFPLYGLIWFAGF